jgi:hypothetical protein
MATIELNAARNRGTDNACSALFQRHGTQTKDIIEHTKKIVAKESRETTKSCQ